MIANMAVDRFLLNKVVTQSTTACCVQTDRPFHSSQLYVVLRFSVLLFLFRYSMCTFYINYKLYFNIYFQKKN